MKNRTPSLPYSGAGYVALVLVSLIALSGCATKKFVRDGMDAQDSRLNGLESQVEANQKRISDTDKGLRSVEGEARQARQIGTEAGEKAGQADARAREALDLAKGKLLYEVVLSDVAGDFALNSDDLSGDAKKELDNLASRLKADNANVFLEIEGHTDSSGPEEYNLILGQRRAESVRRYLNGTHAIPLHRMSVITYGESKPAADNNTREGRAANRRVVIRVLS